MSSPEDNEALKILFQYQHGFIISKIVFTASELGVFDLLLESGEPLSSGAIAERLGTSPSGTERLLEACAGLKLLRMERKDSEGLYRNTNLASLYLAKSSPKSQYYYMKLLSEYGYASFQYFTDAVREGKKQMESIHGPSLDDCYQAFSRSKEEVQRFFCGMDDAWSLYGQEVLSAFDLSHFPIIYDLGGGSGALAKQCISLYPNTTVTVLDRPEVVETAKKHLVSSGICQIAFQEGVPNPQVTDQYWSVSLEEPGRRDRLSRAKGTSVDMYFETGGGVLIIEPLLDEDRSGPLEAQVYSAALLLHFDGKGRAFSEHNTLLSAAGFTDVESKKGKFFDAILGRK
nr:acetylserotonin O-methyltransferase-like [Pogona vitticeps]